MAFVGPLSVSIALVLAFCAVAAVLHVRQRTDTLVWIAGVVAVGLGFVRLGSLRELFVQSVVAATAFALFYVISAGAPIVTASFWLKTNAASRGFADSFRTAVTVALSVLPFSLLIAIALQLIVVQYSCAGNNCL